MTRHAFDPVSFVAGVVFTAIAALYIVQTQTSFEVDARWVLPLMLIGLGVGGVVGALTTAARERRENSAVSESGADEPAARSVSDEDPPSPSASTR